MNTTTKASSTGETLRQWAVAMFVLLAGVIFTFGAGHAHAAPLAGTVIGNQATATYTDASSTSRTATSNLVQTTVSQVKTFTLTASGTRTAAPGQTVFYPHTITNTGNGSDSYTLVVPTAGPNLTNFAAAGAPHGAVAYYADADGNGLPDNATPITAPVVVAAGGNFKFVIAGTVPAGAANTDTGTMVVTVQDTQVTTLSNTDVTTVASSVINVTKSIGPATSGPAGVTLTVTLSYTNSGTVAANTVTITDNVGTGGFTYVPGSGAWSGGGPITDGAGGDPGVMNYTAVGNTVTAVLSSVGPGISGTVSFQMTVPATRAPGAMSNTASFSTSTQASANTNTATYTVLQVASVVANGSTTSSVNFPAAGALEPVTVGSAAAGSTVDFTNVIWNKGNAADTFVISMTPAGWPAGTTFTLLQSDGATSLVANTTPSIPAYAGAACGGVFVTDASGSACGYRVILRVQLPATASGGPYSVTKTATSTFDGSKSDPVTDTLTTIAANTVDITNNAAVGGAGVLGTGAGPGSSLINTTVTPSPSGTTSTTFRLFVTNTGAVADNYNLGVTGVPTGWSVVFYNDGGSNCNVLGASITSTGSLNPSFNKAVCAVVTVPSTVSGNAVPGAYPLTFSSTSTTNGSISDSLIDTVTVATVNNVTLAPPNTQQTFPGGSVTYTHVVTNNGNVTENITWLALTDSQSASGWSSAGYVDATPTNGVFDTGVDDVPAQLLPGGANANFSLAPGASRTIFVRVFAPGSLTATNVTTVTARYNGNALSVSTTDSTSITDGLVLTKSQRTVACDGSSPGTYTTGVIAAGPGTAPGQCLQYQIVAQNTTAANITAVTISDVVPGNTKVVTTAACAAAVTAPGVLGPVSAGMAAPSAVTATAATMTPSQTVTLTFCVQIDP